MEGLHLSSLNATTVPITTITCTMHMPTCTFTGTQQASASAPEETEPKAFELQIPADRAGLVIGTDGKNICEVKRLTNTIIKVDRGLGLLGGENRQVMVVGSEENYKKALLSF